MTTVVSLGTPVTSSRQWATALARRVGPGGGWNFITQAFQYQSSSPSQWTVIDLTTGTAKHQHGPPGVFGNTNFSTMSAHAGQNYDQLVAPNGRIFFAMMSAGAGSDFHLAVYDPLDEEVIPLTLADPGGNPNGLVFTAAFDATGSKLYCGAQATGHAPAIFSVDPVTLDMDLIGHVGDPSLVNPTYAYYLAADRHHLYVAVGEDPWQLIAIDLATRVATTLYTTRGPGRQWMAFDPFPQGWRVSIYDNGVPTLYWLADGQRYPYGDGSNPPFGPRRVTPYHSPLPPDAPQIDWTRGAGQVLTRPAGSTDAWRTINYEVDNRVPVPIESLVALPDGTLLGSTQQYAGFFRVHADNTLEWYGAWMGGPSQPVHAVDGGRAYMAGYANGALFRFDPSAPWDVDSNPVLLGNFHAATDITGTPTPGMKYPYFLRLAPARRQLYCAGRRERDGVGCAIGRYDIATGAFIGTNQNLDGIAAPRGFVVLEDMGVVLLGGTGGVMVHYDLELVETGRATLAGLDSTGELFTTGQPAVILGATSGAAYLYEVVARTVLAKVELGHITACAQASDGRVWCAGDGRLSVIDPATLTVSQAADLSGYDAITGMAWRGADLYLAAGATLLRVSDLTPA